MNNYNLTIKGKILILQVVLMSVFTFCATKLQAKEVILVKKEMNSYLESGEEIDMAEEILTSANENMKKFVKLKIVAQGIQHNSRLELYINDNEKVLGKPLKDQMNTVQFRLPHAEKIKKLKLVSNGAYIKFTKARIYVDEPKDDDFSRTMPKF